MSEMPASFIITWEAGRYHVSIPNYKGGRVVRADIAERMADALEKIVDMSKPGQTVALSQATDIICDVWNEARSAISAWKDGR